MFFTPPIGIFVFLLLRRGPVCVFWDLSSRMGFLASCDFFWISEWIAGLTSVLGHVFALVLRVSPSGGFVNKGFGSGCAQFKGDEVSRVPVLGHVFLSIFAL